MIPGHKGYVKTSIIYVTYDEVVANNLREEISARYKVLTFSKSRVVNGLYFIEIEGNFKDEVEKLIDGRAIWYKVDVLEFK
ncbi:MAG: hypothetical protein QXY36_00620 [Sulfolobales archaeon]